MVSFRLQIFMFVAVSWECRASPSEWTGWNELPVDLADWATLPDNIVLHQSTGKRFLEFFAAAFLRDGLLDGYVPGDLAHQIKQQLPSVSDLVWTRLCARHDYP